MRRITIYFTAGLFLLGIATSCKKSTSQSSSKTGMAYNNKLNGVAITGVDNEFSYNIIYGNEDGVSLRIGATTIPCSQLKIYNNVIAKNTSNNRFFCCSQALLNDKFNSIV